MTTPIRPHLWRLAAPLGLLAGLAACSGSSDTPITPAIARISTCPQAQIAVPADRVSFKGPDDSLRYIAAITDLQSDCRIEADGVEVDLAFALRAEKGPGFADDPVAVSYFVATLDPAQQIIGKQIFASRFVLPPDQPTGGRVETVTLRLPNTADLPITSYRLYIGFQPEGAG